MIVVKSTAKSDCIHRFQIDSELINGIPFGVSKQSENSENNIISVYLTRIKKVDFYACKVMNIGVFVYPIPWNFFKIAA